VSVRPAVELTVTENPLHLVVDNSGTLGNEREYFVLVDPAGTRFFTRDGAFKLDGARTFVHAASGLRLVPRVTVPDGVSDIHVREDGLVLIRHPGDSEQREIAVITTARFLHPESLTWLRNGLVLASPFSGPPMIGRPATRGFGRLLQGVTEVPSPGTFVP
jgi:flagellar basal-body rod protein FlgG